LAQEAAEKSMVMIKNEGNILPFEKGVKRVLMLGKLAAEENTGDHGSSRIFAPHVITPLEGVRSYFGDAVEVIHLDESAIEKAQLLAPEVDCVIIVAGNDYKDEGEAISPGGMEEFIKPILEGYRNMGMPLKAQLMKLGIKLQASQFTGEDGGFVGGDRESLSLKAEEVAMIKAVAGLNPNTVVTLICGSMIMIDDWAKKIPAVLYGWYCGMQGGSALARLLFGDVNPSGKLPFTIPGNTSQLAYFSSTDKTIVYDLYHGYSLLDKDGHRPDFPFGFGLSYTSYAYSDLKVEDAGSSLNVSVVVTNTGDRDGEEVVQVYIGMIDSKIERQRKLLKGFEKVEIESGESRIVTISVAKDDLRYYDMQDFQWVLEPGTYRVMVGPHSSEDVLLEKTINI
jgi:beta-glucosidase